MPSDVLRTLFLSILWRRFKCRSCTETYCTFLFGFVFTATWPAHLLQLPQQAATPRSVAFTVSQCCDACGWESLWQSSVPAPDMLTVCLCVGVSHWGWLLRGQYHCKYVCACLLVHVSNKCVHLHSYPLSLCRPRRGLWSKKKAQERHAAGVQFGAVSCWMLCHKQK